MWPNFLSDLQIAAALTTDICDQGDTVRKGMHESWEHALPNDSGVGRSSCQPGPYNQDPQLGVRGVPNKDHPGKISLEIVSFGTGLGLANSDSCHLDRVECTQGTGNRGYQS